MKFTRTVLLACMLDLSAVEGERLGAGEDSPLMQSVHVAGLMESEIDSPKKTLGGDETADYFYKLKAASDAGAFGTVAQWPDTLSRWLTVITSAPRPSWHMLTMDKKAHEQALSLLSQDACDSKDLAFRLDQMLVLLRDQPALLQVDASQHDLEEELQGLEEHLNLWFEEHGHEAIAAVQQLKTSAKSLLEMPKDAPAQQALVAAAAKAPMLARFFGWSQATTHEALVQDVLLLSQLTSKTADTDAQGWSDWVPGWFGPEEAEVEAEAAKIEEVAQEAEAKVEAKVHEELVVVEARGRVLVAEAEEAAAAALEEAEISAEAKMELAETVLESQAALLKEQVEASEAFEEAAKSVEELNETLQADLTQLEEEGAEKVKEVEELASVELAMAEAVAEKEIVVAKEEVEKEAAKLLEEVKDQGPAVAEETEEEVKEVAGEVLEAAAEKGAEIVEAIKEKVAEVAEEAKIEAAKAEEEASATLPVVVEAAEQGEQALEEKARGEFGDAAVDAAKAEAAEAVAAVADEAKPIVDISNEAANKAAEVTERFASRTGDAIAAHAEQLDSELVSISQEEFDALMVITKDYEAELAPIVTKDLQRLQAKGLDTIEELSERSQLILLKYLEIVRLEQERLTPVIMKEIEELRTAPVETLQEVVGNMTTVLYETFLDLRERLGMSRDGADGVLAEEEIRVLAALLSTNTERFNFKLPFAIQTVKLEQILEAEGGANKLDAWRRESLVELMTETEEDWARMHAALELAKVDSEDIILKK